ncbi:MAG: alpha/beta fold hydrolase [Ardenticatenaceae bacterium]|nr:alpha/beta fold hydrolase [Anaerolineales bacterium]MCB8922668.1 alpha/beta fold hydrolase [Ardenticatenaceae bacterium]MCB8991785.1 alpha/beta fold hydrolase [Ardenticatenaceae bacterium]MCB9003624.1 alpha/beta fold hydrolase [Ardenticatenaceae bacterium]
MSIVWIVLGWIFAAVFGLLTASMLLLHNWLHALALFLVVLLCLPPVNSLLLNRFNFALHPLLRGALIVVLLFVFVRLLTGQKVTSIYASPEAKAQFMALYDEKMTDWPVPYEDIFLDTEYGVVHVIVSGPEDAPPMLLLHASGVAGWSWEFNVAELSEQYRTYAIDLIGDAGKSEFASLDNILQTRQDQADLYAEITEQLGVDKAFVVGASEGGFIGTNYALYYPERVEKLALLGPMGYAGATESVMRIMFAQMFPLKTIQEGTFRWAFGDNPQVNNAFGEWFRLFMTESVPKKVAPLPIPAEERQQLTVPTLFVFGEQDNLVGDPEAARALVQDIPDVRVDVVEAGHLMAAELPEQVDGLILDFFGAETIHATMHHNE